jgi:hypothetical protein
MRLTAWIGLALGVVMAALSKAEPPPVILELGPLVPTPAPTFSATQRKRLVTVITVRNNPQGETAATFEVTDFGDQGKDRVRTLASKTYSLADENPAVKELTERIFREIRELERNMLTYAEKAGPPRERAPIVPQTRP